MVDTAYLPTAGDIIWLELGSHLPPPHGSEARSAAPATSSTPRMYHSGTSGQLSEPPGTTARTSPYRTLAEDGSLDPRVGHEQSGRRPCLVISETVFSTHTMLAVVCPITSRVRGIPFELTLVGTKTQGVVLTHHARSIDLAARHARFIEAAPDGILQTCRNYVHSIIGSKD